MMSDEYNSSGDDDGGNIAAGAVEAGAVDVAETAETAQDGGPQAPDAPEQAEAFDVNYSCLRCGTAVSNTELNRLPEIKCICGFRVFTKVRPPVVKPVKAI